MAYKVITAVATEPVSLAEARLQLRLGADDPTTEDALITALITAARETAEHYTGRGLAPQTLELALDDFPDDEGEAIYLPMGPVASITSVKYTDGDGVEQTIDSGDYALSLYGEANKIAPTYGNDWPTPQDIPDAVRVRYVTGYTTCPKAAVAAIKLMVAWLFEHRGDEMSPDDIQPPAAKSLLNTIKAWGRV